MDKHRSLLQLRASFTSSSQPIRPYSLLTNTEDYNYLPKPMDLRPSRLLRILGLSFKPFWMSVQRPSEVSGLLALKIGSYHNGDNLIEAAAHYRQKIEKEAAKLDLGFMTSDVASSVRDWLVRSVSCGLQYKWTDLGPVFWPRWLRQTDCEKSDVMQSCSFPIGMQCLRAQISHITILAWHCWENDERRNGSKSGPEISVEVETGEAIKKCTWRQVPYPVVTACKCSCT
ncbi:noggin-2-like [Lampris incognitus]|uniref:noggin-2-like n=1 Tax=Lampris incognitus TaxID=2546036 RepID=UPI0024B49C39|nr:noggin-2-like [Lampris incognitus]